MSLYPFGTKVLDQLENGGAAGQTEFRALSDSELAEAIELIEAEAA